MGQAIRVALIALAVVAIIALLGTLVVDVGDMIISGSSFFVTVLAKVTPYLSFGRRLLNAFIGDYAIANWMIIVSVSFPIAHWVASLVARIFRLIIGN